DRTGRRTRQVIEADALAIAHDQRARGEVSQSLAAPVNEERQHADGIEDREEIHDPHQVANRGLPEGQWLTMVADHPQASGTLPQGLSVPGRLADQEVPGQQDEAEDDLDQERELAGAEDTAERGGEDGDRDQDHRDDQRIEDLRQEATANPRDLILEAQRPGLCAYKVALAVGR